MHKIKIRYVLCFVLFCVVNTTIQAASSTPWIHIDSEGDSLHVMQGTKAVVTFTNVAFGKAGVKRYRLRDSEITPKGEFQVVEIKYDSKYHRFLRLNYPNVKDAFWARIEGIIDRETYGSILDALLRRQVPPQDTPLGGDIGIHGIGKGSPRIHRNFDWTKGCVAVTNEQIDALLPWVRIGTRVIIE